ncbi:hypothetical protein P153DRAFT_12367 [Dothidotthia symphoricarpi CBS 119687]|uniref:Uncharacterized protein n=1 Tax=Dothidotthia symphoricarpi CBS 119687 TaxID=1392245 RepID=A0A6A6ASH8_9PLEO|nr:uncharacterized protein P153DRAFT_12367 [Dothidotthia symphoricarpi CBS 119687]KAF2134909.1 hypothetical protein P153DRAFT_12367 [Dothidotthia symphoricarpi CBS 119687]
MGTPHRGLPPPSAMTLPDPGRGPSQISHSLGALPPAPSQWQGSEDGMKNWLAAKTEEEKRKQEEEKTRQENLKLEQRKIELLLLRESMQGGIPPHLVPIIFAGIGGGTLSSISAEQIQQYTAQVQAAQQHQAQAQLSPNMRREARVISQPHSTTYGGQPETPQSILPPTSVLLGQPQSQHAPPTTYGGGPMSPRTRGAQFSGFGGPPTSAPRPPQSQLPRLTTNEMNIEPPPAGPSNLQQQSQSAQQEHSSPSIYFHHWVPPASQQEKSSSGVPPATPSEYTSSPKKRKAQGPHPAPPPPTSTLQSHTSPSFSYVSTSSTSTPGRGGHHRAHSDVSARGPEGSGGAVNRRGTVSGSATRQMDVHEPARGSEGKHPPHLDQVYATPPLRNDGRLQGPPTHASSSAPSQTETRKPGPHHPWGYMSSPKREPGDH